MAWVIYPGYCCYQHFNAHGPGIAIIFHAAIDGEPVFKALKAVPGRALDILFYRVKWLLIGYNYKRFFYHI